MSTLVVYLPPRPRLRARGDTSSAPRDVAPPGEFTYVISPDGLVVDRHGRATAALLPKATAIVAVIAEADVSWHRITLPKAPAAKLRAALVGVLEEDLLADAEAVHLALAPGAVAGQPAWVAAIDRVWLRNELARLQRARVFVDRVVPMAWPDDPPIGHFSVEDGAEPGAAAGSVSLTWAHADGVAQVRLLGGLAKSLLPTPLPPMARWSTAPAAAVAAEQWLGAAITVMPFEQRLLQAARSLWNLRQFDLASRTRGARALRDSVRGLLSPKWRPVRIGLAALVAAQVIGLNLWAWHERSAIESRRAALQTLVKSSFPRVGDNEIQRDPAAVMQRETQSVRALAGKAGDTDLEPLLQAAASAWPPGRPVENLRFEPGKLTLAATGWSDAQIETFRNVLKPGGWQVDATEGRVTVSRARTGGTG